MQMVKRIIGGFFLSLILLWLFAPKQELYYLLEKKLKENDIIISNEHIEDTWIGFNISNADIYVKGINIAKATELKFNAFFLYNTLTIKDINIDASLHNVAPKVINNIKATYSVINPRHIEIKGLGSFGTLNGYFSILKQDINIQFPIVKNIKSFKKFLKKDEKGVWKYETSLKK